MEKPVIHNFLLFHLLEQSFEFGFNIWYGVVVTELYKYDFI